MIKGLMAGLFGMACATMGMAPIDAASRFTFGSTQLAAGLDLLPMLIGMFALSEILNTAETSRIATDMTIRNIDLKKTKGFGFSWAEFKAQNLNFWRSSAIGLGIGILPGIGGSTSNLISYSVAKNQSKTPEKFGTGIPDGVVATETANSATCGGCMVPLLTLGIPGDMVTAMLLGGLMIHGITPGPLLFTEQQVFVYGIFAAMIVASFFMLFQAFYGLRFFIWLLRTPKYILMPIIFVLCIVGAFGLNNRMFDAYLGVAFGLVGYFFLKFKLPVAPFIMGFILGPMVETFLRRGLMLSRGDFLPFLTEPVSGAFLLIAALSVMLTFRKTLSSARARRQGTTITASTNEKDGKK
jgi:putative tricarboxylic transport membrane protein